MTIKIPGEVIPYIYLIGIDLKYDLESGFGKPNNTPHYELPGIRPRIAQLIIDSVHFVNQKIPLDTCLVPRPHYLARPKRFESRGHRSELTERDWENSCIETRQGGYFLAFAL